MRITSLRSLLFSTAVALPFFAMPAAHAAATCVVNGIPVTSESGFISGTANSDVIDCSSSPERVAIHAGAGNDRVIGTAEGDFIQGGPGNDSIDGRGGDDFIAGDQGNDHLVGGSGDDIITGGNVDFDSGQEITGSGNDFLDGGSGNDFLDGLDGSDVLRGGPGDDLLDGPPNDGARDSVDGGTGFDGCAGFTGSSLGGPDPDFFSNCEAEITSLVLGIHVDPGSESIRERIDIFTP